MQSSYISMRASNDQIFISWSVQVHICKMMLTRNDSDTCKTQPCICLFRDIIYKSEYLRIPPLIRRKVRAYAHTCTHTKGLCIHSSSLELWLGNEAWGCYWCTDSALWCLSLRLFRIRRYSPFISSVKNCICAFCLIKTEISSKHGWHEPRQTKALSFAGRVLGGLFWCNADGCSWNRLFCVLLSITVVNVIRRGGYQVEQAESTLCGNLFKVINVG